MVNVVFIGGPLHKTDAVLAWATAAEVAGYLSSCGTRYIACYRDEFDRVLLCPVKYSATQRSAIRWLTILSGGLDLSAPKPRDPRDVFAETRELGMRVPFVLHRFMKG